MHARKQGFDNMSLMDAVHNSFTVLVQLVRRRGTWLASQRQRPQL